VRLVGTVLLGRSFARLVDVDPGFRTDGTVLMHVTLRRPEAGEDTTPLAQFHEQAMERLRALPGVEAVGGVTLPPLAREPTANGALIAISRPDEITTFEQFVAASKDPVRTKLAEFRVASDDYFGTLGIPLLRGRLFEQGDGPGAEHVAVLSRSLADLAFPGQDPLGKLLQFGNMDGDLTPFRVVGVVGDVREFGVDAEARPTFYGYYRQRSRVLSSFWTAIRAPNAASLIPAARKIVQDMDPDLAPVFQTSSEMFARSIAERRFNLTLLATFAAAGLLLALAGIYGAIAFHVAQRTREIGVRMALGAAGGSVVALIVRRSLIVAAAGVGAGLVVAAAGSRLIGSLLYDVSAYDPAAYGVAAILMLAAALIASWLPAMRAAGVDPMAALRSE
jgi:predicted permease